MQWVQADAWNLARGKSGFTLAGGGGLGAGAGARGRGPDQPGCELLVAGCGLPVAPPGPPGGPGVYVASIQPMGGFISAEFLAPHRLSRIARPPSPPACCILRPPRSLQSERETAH